MTSWSAQDRTVIPARDGPRQNWFMATFRMPLAGMTRSNSTAVSDNDHGAANRADDSRSSTGGAGTGVRGAGS